MVMVFFDGTFSILILRLGEHRLQVPSSFSSTTTYLSIALLLYDMEANILDSLNDTRSRGALLSNRMKSFLIGTSAEPCAVQLEVGIYFAPSYLIDQCHWKLILNGTQYEEYHVKSIGGNCIFQCYSERGNTFVLHCRASCLKLVLALALDFAMSRKWISAIYNELWVSSSGASANGY